MIRELVYIWKPCPDYESSYEISNFGDVRKKSTKRLLKPYINRRGYPEVRLFKSSKATAKVVHRLVAKAFLENTQNLPQVNHIDGNKLNNCISNLEWTNNSENQKHAFKLGLKKAFGENNPKATLSDVEVTKLKELYNSGLTIKQIVEKLKIPVSIIRNIIYGITWKSNKTAILKRDDRRSKLKLNQ